MQVVTIGAFGTPEARTTTRTLNSRGDVLTLLTANGGTTGTEYSRLSQPLRQTSPIGVSTTWTYDSLGRLRTEANGETGNRTYTFDDDGFLTSSTDGEGNVSSFQYDLIGRVLLRRVTPPGGQPEDTTYTYDQAQYTNPLGELTRIATTATLTELGYDRYARPASQSFTLDGTKYTQLQGYDPAGRARELTYPDGDTLRTGYDGQGYLFTLDLVPAGGGTPKRYGTYTGYNAQGNPGNAAFGNTLSSTYSYFTVPQALGRLHTATVESGGTPRSNRTYGWNRFGQVLTVDVSPQSEKSEAFTYDSMGWVRTAQGPFPSATYDYDLAGNLQGLDGVSFTYPQSSNQISNASNGLSLTYDANGNTTTQSLAGVDTVYTYNGLSRLTRIEEGGRATLLATYDASGNRVKKVDENGVISRYLFPLYNMVEEGASRRYTKIIPGPDGPLAALTVEAPETSAAAAHLSYQRQRLAASLYDRGSLRGMAAHAVARIKAVGLHPRLEGLWVLGLIALVAAVFLLPWSLRWLRRLGHSGDPDSDGEASRTRYARRHGLYAAVVPWVVLVLSAGLVSPAQADLGPGSGYPEAGELFFHHNQVQSTVMVTDDEGNPLSEVTYEPYGEIVPDQSSGPDDFRPKFTSKELDSGTGLYYFGARYQDPALGRFLQPDAARQFASPYSYVGDDPANSIDPDGNFAITLTVILVGAIIGAVAGAYFGGAAVNHSYNPAHWNWRSGKTYAGIFAGAAIGAVGGALGAVAGEAGVAVGIAGEMLIGAGENAAFTALGGGSLKEIGISALEGAVFGAALGAGSRLLGAGLRQAGKAAAPYLRRASEAASPLVRRARSALDDLGTRATNGMRRLMGRCSSFPAGTLVSTEHGLVPIEALEAGDRVWSEDTETGDQQLHPVTRLFHREAAQLVRVTTSGETFEATEAHPFQVEAEGWILAAHLRPGDRLVTRSGATLTVESVEVLPAMEEPVPVFNLEVQEDHNYFVSTDQALVHNCFGFLSRMLGSPAAFDALSARAAQVHGVLDPIARNRRTAAILETDAGVTVASGVRDISPVQRAQLLDGEIELRHPRLHAEDTLLTRSLEQGWRPRRLVASRNFCPNCIARIEETGGTILGPRSATWLWRDMY